jgi:hypothetical protein
VSINSSGLITASATQTAGYVSAGTKSSTKQLTTQAAKTVTPTKSSQTAIASGVYTTGAVTVAAIPDQYITTIDATASADEIMSGETAYVNGSKVTGTFSIDNELSTQDDLISQIQAAVDSLPEAGGGELTLQNKTVTPTTSSQTITADSGYDGLDTVTVNAIPSTYVKPSATKGATTYTPNTSNQTIASGTYCSGTQTIKGDSNLIASNIKSGVSIFGVLGSYSGSSSGGGETPGGNTPESGDGGSTPESSTVQHVGATGFAESTAEGSVIFVGDTPSGVITSMANLTYFSYTKKYRFTLPNVLIANTPIIVLTSGTITMPSSANGYTATLITSGSGYAVYKYTK